jgi:hypothetical protein
MDWIRLPDKCAAIHMIRVSHRALAAIQFSLVGKISAADLGLRIRKASTNLTAGRERLLCMRLRVGFHSTPSRLFARRSVGGRAENFRL